MKLCDKLITRISSNGKRYRVDLDFRNVLMMTEILARHDLLADAKRFLALRCIMSRPPHDNEKCKALFDTACELLFGNSKPNGSKKLTDFEQDADMIRAAFLQVYGVNLWRDKLHWHEFSALLTELPGGNRYMDVLGIRARPMPEATKYNAKEREWLSNAKAACALDMTEDERNASYRSGLRAMSESMRAIAKWGGGK